MEEPTVQDSSADTDKSFVRPETKPIESAIGSGVFAFDDENSDSSGQPISASALDDLPTAQPAISFVANLDLGEDDLNLASQVDPVEINVGEEKESRAEQDSTLGSFLKKLPR